MSRTSKHDRAFRNAPKPEKMTVREYKQKLFHEVKKRLKAAGLLSTEPKYEYHWQLGTFGEVGTQGGIVKGNQKTDARYLIKKALGVDRLPKDIKIVRVIPNANQQQRLAASEIGTVSG